MAMILVHGDTMLPVKLNERVKSFRGEPYVVTCVTRGAPRHPGSTGRVEVRPLGSMMTTEFYPGVFGLKWHELP